MNTTPQTYCKSLKPSNRTAPTNQSQANFSATIQANTSTFPDTSTPSSVHSQFDTATFRKQSTHPVTFRGYEGRCHKCKTKEQQHHDPFPRTSNNPSSSHDGSQFVTARLFQRTLTTTSQTKETSWRVKRDTPGTFGAREGHTQHRQI